MNRWVRRARGAVGMGLTWAIAWGLFGIGIGISSILLPWLPWDRVFAVYDAPLPTLAMPGFITGAFFSVVLGIAGRRRSFHELSMPRFAAWGALGGVLVGLVPAALVSAGLGTLRADLSLWAVTGTIAVPLAFLGAASAAGSLALARRGEGRRPGAVDRAPGDASLAEGPATGAPAHLSQGRARVP